MGSIARRPRPPLAASCSSRLSTALLTALSLSLSLSLSSCQRLSCRYPSNYLVFQQTQNPDVKLPAWPVRVACDHMMGTGTAADTDTDTDTDKDTDTDSDAGTDTAVLERLRDAGGVLYNVTGAEVRCSTGACAVRSPVVRCSTGASICRPLAQSSAVRRLPSAFCSTDGRASGRNRHCHSHASLPTPRSPRLARHPLTLLSPADSLLPIPCRFPADSPAAGAVLRPARRPELRWHLGLPVVHGDAGVEARSSNEQCTTAARR
jgi:hypothetical protein